MACFCHVCNERVTCGTRRTNGAECHGTVVSVGTHPEQDKLMRREIARWMMKFTVAVNQNNKSAEGTYRAKLAELGVTV